MATNVVIKFCSVSLLFGQWGALGQSVGNKEGNQERSWGGSLSQNLNSHSFLGWGRVRYPGQESEGWCSFSLGNLNVKVLSHSARSGPPACPPKWMCDHCWHVGEVILGRTAVGSAGQESLVFTPPSAQGFELTNSVVTFKSLVIQWHLRTHKFRINQTKWFLKPASQWHPIPQSKWVGQLCQPLETV